jgi:anaerobic selenocysteine-containing dehydrogenase
MMTPRHPNERSRQTFCRICEAACGWLADLDASGQLVRLRPDRQHPISQGFVYAKGTRFLEVAAHPDRLLAPLHRRADGTCGRAHWRRRDISRIRKTARHGQPFEGLLHPSKGSRSSVVSVVLIIIAG